MKIDLAPILERGCARCRKPFGAGDTASIVYRKPKGRPKRFLREGDELFALQAYHSKCIPPVWWRMQQGAGSRPASDAPPDAVPQ